MSQEAYIEGMFEKFKEHCDSKTVTEPFPAKNFLMPLDNCGKPIDGVTSNRLMPILCGHAALPPLPEPKGQLKRRDSTQDQETQESTT